MAEDWGYSEREPLYAGLTLADWCAMLEGEDPDDRAIREAHGIGYREPYSTEVKCRNGCGLSYVELSAGKVRECEATPVGLNCPGCGEPPRHLLGGGTQAFCGTDDCPWLTWDPTLTLAELNADANVINLSGSDDG